jgi:molecular chaperone GrpE
MKQMCDEDKKEQRIENEADIAGESGDKDCAQTEARDDASQQEGQAAESDGAPQDSEAPDESEPQEAETVEGLRGQLHAQKDKYIRLMAEFDNYKRRTAKEYERIIESASERLMLDIIETRESFERALKVDESNSDFKTMFEGMKLIFSKLDDVLKKNGLSVFAEVGDEFDPQIHDAMMKIPNAEIPEDHIVEIYEKGYRLRTRVIKHAKVIVSSGPPDSKQAETKNGEEKDSS